MHQQFSNHIYLILRNLPRRVFSYPIEWMLARLIKCLMGEKWNTCLSKGHTTSPYRSCWNECKMVVFSFLWRRHLAPIVYQLVAKCIHISGAVFLPRRTTWKAVWAFWLNSKYPSFSGIVKFLRWLNQKPQKKHSNTLLLCLLMPAITV